MVLFVTKSGMKVFLNGTNVKLMSDGKTQHLDWLGHLELSLLKLDSILL